jgi:hypothetical protein
MTTRRYAQGTEKDVSYSEGELKRLLRDYGATRIASLTEDGGQTIVQVEMRNRWLRFSVKYPAPTDEAVATYPKSGNPTPPDERQWRCESEYARRWRAFVKLIHMHLEAVRDGAMDFDQAFLPFIMLGDGEDTFGSRYAPAISDLYERGIPPPGLMTALPPPRPGS